MRRRISQAPTRSKADSVSRWRESAKRVADMAKAGTLPAHAAPQSTDRDAPNWDPFCSFQGSLPEELLGKAANKSVEG